MNADLARSLDGSFRTIAAITSQSSAEECQSQANNYWIGEHRMLPWTIINTELTLHTHMVRAVDNQHVQSKSLGILQAYTLQDAILENTLWIYTTDSYTENWVHELILARTYHTDSGNRVLNIAREDKGPILDLGKLTLPG